MKELHPVSETETFFLTFYIHFAFLNCFVFVCTYCSSIKNIIILKNYVNVSCSALAYIYSALDRGASVAARAYIQ